MIISDTEKIYLGSDVENPLRLSPLVSYHTVSWSKTILSGSTFLKAGLDGILSSIGERNEGRSPKHRFVLTFRICTKLKEESRLIKTII
jgi:hypothetical protein